MTEDEAYSRLRRLLVEVDAESAALGFAATSLAGILHAYQRAPKPHGDYAELVPLGFRDSGEGAAYCYDTVQYGGVERVVEIRTSGVAYGWRIDIYASRAADVGRAFRAALKSARAQLDLAPLVISEVGEVKASAEREQENWSGRANLNVTLTTMRTQRTLIDVIERGHIDLSGRGARSAPVHATIDYDKA